MFSLSIVVLVGLVAWVTVRAAPDSPTAGRPILVVPTPYQVPVGDVATPTPSASAPASPATSAPSAASPSRTPKRTKFPSVRATPSRPPSHRTPPRLFVMIRATASWDAGYIAFVRIINRGSTAAPWSITVSHSGFTGVQLNRIFNAAGRQQGDSFVFTGPPLAPGTTTTFYYQMTKDNSPTPARPARCTVVGGRCRVS